MISTSDFIQLPYTTDLTEGGIAYAARSLTHGYDRLGESLYSRLRQIVGGAAVELAFRRHLSARGIPYEVKNAAPFSEPERYDVSLGGRRCDVHTLVTSRRSQISAMRRDPGLMLQAPALIPEDQLSTVDPREKDLYIFALLLGLTTNSPRDMHKAAEAGQPLYLIHPMPEEWSQPRAWVPLGRLALKSENSSPVSIEIGGQDVDRNFITERLSLEPLTRVFAQNKYYSLAYIHADGIPTARLGVHSPVRGEIYLIQPHEWGNIWVYGLEIWLAGYMPQDEFRRRASTSFTGSRVFQYSRTQTKNLSVPVTDLRSMDNLYEQVKNWQAEKRSW